MNRRVSPHVTSRGTATATPGVVSRNSVQAGEKINPTRKTLQKGLQHVSTVECLRRDEINGRRKGRQSPGARARSTRSPPPFAIDGSGGSNARSASPRHSNNGQKLSQITTDVNGGITARRASCLASPRDQPKRVVDTHRRSPVARRASHGEQFSRDFLF